MKKSTLLITAIIVVILAVAAGFAIGAGMFSKKAPAVEVSPGQIHDIKSYVRLCSVELYAEVPVRDTINNKVIMAIQKQSGSISFDVENVVSDLSGDTVRVTLPPEIVEVHESTDPNSWQVIDTKNISTLGFLKSSRLSVNEENAVKARAREHAVQRLYNDGTVQRARNEASVNLQTLLTTLLRKPVIVTGNVAAP